MHGEPPRPFRPTAPRVLATAVAVAVTVAVVLVWWWLLAEPADVPQPYGWTLTGLAVALVAVTSSTDRWAGTGAGPLAVTVGAVVAAVVLAIGAGWTALLAAASTAVPLAAFVLGATAAVSGIGHVVRRVRPGRRRWVWVVVGLSTAAWFGWADWWVLDEVPPAPDDALLTAMAATLALAVVLGDVLVRPWVGALLTVGTFALVSFGPTTGSDPLGIIAWFVLVFVAAAGAAVVSGALLLGRSARGRWSRGRTASTPRA